MPRGAVHTPIGAVCFGAACSVFILRRFLKIQAIREDRSFADKDSNNRRRGGIQVRFFNRKRDAFHFSSKRRYYRKSVKKTTFRGKIVVARIG